MNSSSKTGHVMHAHPRGNVAALLGIHLGHLRLLASRSCCFVCERFQEAKAAAKGGKRTEKKKSAVDDEAELRKLRAEEAAKLREQRMQEALAELKYSDKAKDMKEQEMMRLQMQNAYKTGDKALAEKLMARLAPDDPAKAK
eukprot:360207-Chlamydomonas_euryale.AAC.11